MPFTTAMPVGSTVSVPSQVSSLSSNTTQAHSSTSRSRHALNTLIHHVKKHVGVGIICAVAYFDPGNWSVDLAAGTQFGYKLLFMVLAAGLGAVVLQTLACKIGVVTGLDLAQHSRLLLNNHPKYPRLVRWVVLYPLYALAELAIVSTDLAELLGSAIGLVLIFPKLPLPVAVVLTALDVFIILAVGDPSRGHGRPVRIFEYFVIVLVFIVFVCFFVLLVKVSPEWKEVFDGFLPSKALIDPNGIYVAIGIIGATIMPHALFLGSHLATQDRIGTAPAQADQPPAPVQAQSRSLKSVIYKLFRVSRMDVEVNPTDLTTPYGDRDNNSLSFVKGHLVHALVDIVMSLLCVAVAINSAILILAGAVFFFAPGRTQDGEPAGLFDAHELIGNLLGAPFAFIFALALLCSGQGASVTATLAGQIVSEGFINWTISPFLRRIVTRLFSLLPAMIVAIIVGRRGIDTLLVISQVILSIVLPFVTFPLIYVTSSRLAMRVRRPRSTMNEKGIETLATGIDLHPGDADDEGSTDQFVQLSKEHYRPGSDGDSAVPAMKPRRMDSDHSLSDGASAGTTWEHIDNGDDYVDYSNGWPLTIAAYFVWVIVVLANGYLLITLAIDGASGGH